MNHGLKFSGYAGFLLLGASVLVVVLGSFTAQAATYYVATTGSDSNPGTVNQPFKTFDKVVSPLKPGDTLYIRGGLYTERIYLMDKTGTPGNYITIAGYPGETVTLRYADPRELSHGPIWARGARGYFIFENLVLDGSASSDVGQSGWALRDGNHHFIIRNVEIKNFKNVPGILVKASDVVIQNCKFHDQASTLMVRGTYNYGIYLSDGNNVLIEGSEFYRNPGGGLQVYPGPLRNVVIRNNNFHDNNLAEHIVIGGLIVMSARGGISDVQIYNNLIHNNGSAATSGKAPGLRIEASLSTATTNVRVWNNTIYRNKGYGLKIGPGVSIVAQNNIVFGNTGEQIINAGSGSLISHNFTNDPQFINAEALDFRLQRNSPAIDRGSYVEEVNKDYREASRPKGAAYDLGAYERDDSDGQAVSAPQELNIR